MARPQLDEQERRARTVGVRVTATEAAELRERAHRDPQPGDEREGVMVVKMSSPGRSFGGVADYCLRAGGPDHGSHGGGVPGVETPGGGGGDGAQAGEAGVPLFAELGQG